MILDGLLNFLSGLLEPVIAVLPTGELPAGVNAGAANFATAIQQVDYFVPILGPLNFVLLLFISAVPALVTYRIGMFVFDKVRGA